MTATPLWAQLINLLAAVLLLLAFAMLAQRRVLTLINLFAAQGLALASSTAIVAFATGQKHLYWSAGLTLILKVALLPWLLHRLIRKLDVRWDVEGTSPQRFPARIALQSVNEPGTLAQISQVIAEHDGNIDNIRMARRSPDFTEMVIDLEVYDLKHLTAIIAQLRAKHVVASAERVIQESVISNQ